MTRKGNPDFKDEGKGRSNDESKVIPIRIDLDTLEELESVKGDDSRNNWVNTAIKEKLDRIGK